MEGRPVRAPPVVASLPPVMVGIEPVAAAEEPEPVMTTEEDWIDLPVGDAEFVLDPVAEPVFDAVFAEPVLDAVFAVEDSCASLSDFAAEERLGTPPELEAAEMGAARSVAAARAKRGDRENLMMNVRMCNRILQDCMLVPARVLRNV
jgi:hypothetical protein